VKKRRDLHSVRRCTRGSLVRIFRLLRQGARAPLPGRVGLGVVVVVCRELLVRPRVKTCGRPRRSSLAARFGGCWTREEGRGARGRVDCLPLDFVWPCPLSPQHGRSMDALLFGSPKEREALLLALRLRFLGTRGSLPRPPPTLFHRPSDGLSASASASFSSAAISPSSAPSASSVFACTSPIAAAARSPPAVACPAIAWTAVARLGGACWAASWPPAPPCSSCWGRGEGRGGGVADSGVAANETQCRNRNKQDHKHATDREMGWSTSLIKSSS